MKLLDLLGDTAVIAANPVVGLAKVALDVAPDIASLFGDDAEKVVSKLADTVRAVTGTDDPAQAREALADPNLVFQLRSQAQAFAHEERMQEMANAVTTLTATLGDRQNARARDTEFIRAGRSNIRANVLLVTAGAGIVGGIAFMVFGHVDGNTAVGGCIISVVTLLAGKFATAFDFEFGGSADSEQTRTLLAQAPPIGK
ncbi:hypothetical protein [Magnetospirillum sp. 15-1]|uniref:hypothetical protein n=1 Tax=Magnetospirillum sp. 15-1 TaxID=1979370 RepID=UPI000BBBCC44|nr:hypothetical protein [Magnetospirillum sp. 15-1]